jgi:hypothetical protein
LKVNLEMNFHIMKIRAGLAKLDSDISGEAAL